jgi:hypothetical protein
MVRAFVLASLWIDVGAGYREFDMVVSQLSDFIYVKVTVW